MQTQDDIKTTSGCDGLSLFSGGLDSILAARLLQDQGLRVKCLHFISPFFGNAGKIKHWRRVYGLDIIPVDISEEFVDMLAVGPAHGFGSMLNPCVDCKILMLRRAAQLMEEYGATFVASGEVLGQRPMSQRRDSLNIIRRETGLKEALLRPLSAKLLDPTKAELDGLVDRERLLDISGRGRSRQMQLAADFGITEIPTPAGGCLLTERENTRAFWPLLRLADRKPGLLTGRDFQLAQAGRQYWRFEGEDAYWLCIGRNNADNEFLHKFAAPGDITLKVRDYPGPLALLRRPVMQGGGELSDSGGAASLQDSPTILLSAAALVASFSGKAVQASHAAAEAGGDSKIKVRAHSGERGLDGPGNLLEVVPDRDSVWAEFPFEQAKDEIKLMYRCEGPNGQGKGRGGAE
ncbi:MAG: tRNA(5-methylaminomethyl-2-thiouridylate) methyltransferase [Deltaproteobacteria bacterium]|jgi:tRNA U34 2-thiouridine synthase MnmA/TrmU|nr:tRNA(5-methylaminomethyl-2-thiouridylate) methyltransferase [Deltaproteobacteria bacterium]